MDFKKEAAAHAITLVRDKSIIGLGAGTTIAHVAHFLKKEIEKGMQLQFVTSSFSTLQLLLKGGFHVLPNSSMSKIDIYFDGCDQLDKNLNALKSGGGIHTQEKLLASMADQFVLIGDQTKLVDNLDGRFPLVIELLPEAQNYVPVKIDGFFKGVKSIYRTSDKKDGPVITGNGNYLLDLWFQSWPELSTINPTLKTITGVVETSLFYNMATKAIIAGEDGVKVMG